MRSSTRVLPHSQEQQRAVTIMVRTFETRADIGISSSATWSFAKTQPLIAWRAKAKAHSANTRGTV